MNRVRPPLRNTILQRAAPDARNSKVIITKLKLDKDRKALLERKNSATKKGKYTEKETA